MPISLDAIYKPLKDFFLQKFTTEAGSPVQFRFDQFGSVMSDQDFIDPSHPELGYLPALAVEKFSDLVNHIPIEAGDGINLVLSADSIDETYFFRLLSPSSPHIPAGMNEDSKQAIIDGFSAVKADALRVWEKTSLASMTGLMLSYKPSLATPEGWYDKGTNDVWTHHSLQVNETETSTPAPAGPANQLWRLKLSDTTMKQILLSSEMQPAVRASIAPLMRVVLADPAQAPAPIGNREVRRVHLAHTASPPAPAVPVAGTIARNKVVILPRGRGGVAEPVAGPALQDHFVQQFHTLDVSQRLVFNQYVQSKAPTESVRTSSVGISFDYCLVNVRRLWYVDAFINSSSWEIPTVAKGQLTASSPASNLRALPIAFVALRNLLIEANWTAEDITHAAQATGFGPFKVAWGVDNKLSHPGLQIVGWLLQALPDLPPNDSPA